MLSLPVCARPSYSMASSARIEDTARQGLPHSAQKSTRTGREDLRSSCGKLVSVRVTMLGADIRNQEMRFGFIIAQSRGEGRLSFEQIGSIASSGCPETNNQRLPTR